LFTRLAIGEQLRNYRDGSAKERKGNDGQGGEVRTSTSKKTYPMNKKLPATTGIVKSEAWREVPRSPVDSVGER